MTALDPVPDMTVDDLLAAAKVSRSSLRSVLRGIESATKYEGFTLAQISELGQVSESSIRRVFRVAPNHFVQSLDSGWPFKYYCRGDLARQPIEVLEREAKTNLAVAQRPMGANETYFTNGSRDGVINVLLSTDVPITLSKAGDIIKELAKCHNMATTFLAEKGPMDIATVNEHMSKVPAVIDALRGIAAGLTRIEAHPLYGMPTQYLALLTEGTEAP